MKPTELQKHNVIYINETDTVLTDEDYPYSVKITVDMWSAQGMSIYFYLLEKLPDGTYTQHNISGVSVGDTIELSPCKYGFCLSNLGGQFSVREFIGGSSPLTFVRTTIDLTDYNTKSVQDFSGMFIDADVIGGENIDTSKGIIFDYMCFNSTLNKFPLTLSINAISANLHIPTFKFTTLDLTGGKMDSLFLNYTGTNYPSLFYNTANFFDEYQYTMDDKKKQAQTLTKIIADDENLARFVHYCASKQNLSFEFVKPNGEAWSFE